MEYGCHVDALAFCCPVSVHRVAPNAGRRGDTAKRWLTFYYEVQRFSAQILESEGRKRLKSIRKTTRTRYHRRPGLGANHSQVAHVLSELLQRRAQQRSWRNKLNRPWPFSTEQDFLLRGNVGHHFGDHCGIHQPQFCLGVRSLLM